MDDLVYASAAEVLSGFRARTLSPVEVLEAVVARMDVVEPVVNAYAELRLDEARESAREAERRYDGHGPAPRPLEGLPVAIKEEQPVVGWRMRYGSELTEGLEAEVTHPAVERVLAAGAVAVGRTTTPEFSCAAFTHSTLWGVTRNPWNTELTPGGSSGGSGAALASGTAYLATGSDIGGSIRIPASFCGVVGFKPPYGRVPALPPFNLDVFCHDGPMARTVADCALLENVIVGPHPHDHVSLRPALLIPEELAGIEGLRVGLIPRLGDFPVDPEVVAATRAFGEALARAGAIVEEITLPITRELVHDAALPHFGALMGPSMQVDESDERLMPYTRDFLRRAREGLERIGTVPGQLLEAQVHSILAEVFERFDALVVYTLGTLGLSADSHHVDEKAVVDGEVLDFYLTSATTPVFNIASRHPVLNVPSGVSSTGVPMGVQIVAPTYDDVTAFRVGAAAERELRWWADPLWRPTLSGVART